MHRKRWGRALVLLAALAAGCVSDGTLLDENSAMALRSARARARARQDLNCPAASVGIVSEKEVPGAPWGYLCGAICTAITVSAPRAAVAARSTLSNAGTRRCAT